jgi:hypothetical protein
MKLVYYILGILLLIGGCYNAAIVFGKSPTEHRNCIAIILSLTGVIFLLFGRITDKNEYIRFLRQMYSHRD